MGVKEKGRSRECIDSIGFWVSEITIKRTGGAIKIYCHGIFNLKKERRIVMKVCRVIACMFLVLSVVLSACSNSGSTTATNNNAGATKAEAASSTVKPVSTSHEAPMLADLVASGKMPPLEKRLPEKPFVDNVDKIGTYGGTLHKTYSGVTDYFSIMVMGCRQEGFVYVNGDGSIKPNLIESWKYEGDKKDVVVISLRKGIKWSDGVDFTVDDIMYDLGVRATGKVPLENNGLQAVVFYDKIEKIDNYTLRLPLKYYYPIEYTATYEQPYAPEHYMKKFDPRFNSSSTWEDLTAAYCSYRNSDKLVGFPQLSPWVVTSYKDNGLVIAERNPYYWKVDQEGNQLPYIDKIEFSCVSNLGSIPAMIAAGNIDFQFNQLSFADYPYFKQNEQAGNYITKTMQSASLSTCIRLNYACKDLDLRELFRNMDFRVALSVGIDRDAINNSVYFGLVKPWGGCALSSCSYYPGDKYSSMYTQYDPGQAKALLEKLGLKDTNNDGIREIKGKPLTIVIDAEDGYGSGPLEGIKLIAEQWRLLGIDAKVNVVERPLLLASWEKNSYTAYAWKLDGAIDPDRFSYAWACLSAPDFYWHNVGVPLQAYWHSNGKEGIELPKFLVDINKAMEAALKSSDPKERTTLSTEANKLYAENLMVIPTTTYVECGIVSNKLGNVPENCIAGNEVGIEKQTRPWTFFYSN